MVMLVRVGDVVKKKGKVVSSSVIEPNSKTQTGAPNPSSDYSADGENTDNGHSKGFWILLIIQLLMYSMFIWLPLIYLGTHLDLPNSELACDDALLSESMIGWSLAVTFVITLIYIVVLFKVQLKSTDEYDDANLYSFWGAVLLPTITSLVVVALSPLSIGDALGIGIAMFIFSLIGVFIIEATSKAVIYEGVLNGDGFKILVGIFLMGLIVYIFGSLAPYTVKGWLCI